MAGKIKEIPEGARAAYAGRFLLGWIFARGEEFVALRNDRTILGTFPSELLAKNALWVGEDVEP
ncbi:hypothetical protein [Bradyrhizobium sp. CCBAU 53415]|uniref:hypothetical protein n=1 Tax=Bradyrhizobium sp. CCBAU 53415 TaxID=1325119 RepID=UPI002306250A|nr:hypothetical protein [Bradyrhizobium sp. CCBAU 53415]MDA9465330.1 hypothetical protein [Bradyrhizobium sp. CCBAU 53415]